MSFKDWLLIFVAYASVAAGFLLPDLAGPLEWYPRCNIMLLLFLSFLGLRTREVLKQAFALRGRLALLIVAKLVLVPFLALGVFYLTAPQFALGVFLLAGAPAGASSSFFALLMRADISLVLGGTVLTSLLAPFTLPALTALILPFLGYSPDLLASFSPWRMSLDICSMIFIPYLLAQLAQAFLPGLSGRLMSGRYWISIAGLALSHIAIFARYSPMLRDNPTLILPSLTTVTACGVIFFGCGALLARRWPLPQQLGLGISFCVTNNVLAMLLGFNFFTLIDALPAALFTIPSFFVILFCRWVGHIRRTD